MAREGQLPVEESIGIAREVLAALGAAHAHGIVHRDIKPENILLSGGHALVADFGIAKAVGEGGGERLTETGLAIGTLSYMSPEQAAAERDVDARSDLYSVGCVLYEMLAGEPPLGRADRTFDSCEAHDRAGSLGSGGCGRRCRPVSRRPSPGRWPGRRPTVSRPRPSSRRRLSRVTPTGQPPPFRERAAASALP